MSTVARNDRQTITHDPIAEIIERLTVEYTGTPAGGAVLRSVARAVRAARSEGVEEASLATLIEPLVRDQLARRLGLTDKVCVHLRIRDRTTQPARGRATALPFPR
jgi:hypothetical protein